MVSGVAPSCRPAKDARRYQAFQPLWLDQGRVTPPSPNRIEGEIELKDASLARVDERFGH
jgi:hypothetical protein